MGFFHPRTRSAALVACGVLALAGAALAATFPSRIYVTEMPKAELDAKNENFNPALVVGPRREDRSRRIKWRNELVGQSVVVEGIALGEPPEQPSHMTTQRVAYEGGRIFVRGVDFKAARAGGKLVRVSGTLRHEQESRLDFAPDHKVEQYFYIEGSSVEVLERTEDPVLLAPSLR